MPSVLGVNVSASSYAEVVDKCTEWAKAAESRTVLFVSMHGIMEAHDKPAVSRSHEYCRPCQSRRHARRLGASRVWRP